MSTSVRQAKPESSFVGYVDGPLLGSVVRYRKTLVISTKTRTGRFKLIQFTLVVIQHLNAESQVTKREVRWAEVKYFKPEEVNLDDFELFQLVRAQLTKDGYEVTI